MVSVWDHSGGEDNDNIGRNWFFTSYTHCTYWSLTAFLYLLATKLASSLAVHDFFFSWGINILYFILRALRKNGCRHEAAKLYRKLTNDKEEIFEKGKLTCIVWMSIDYTGANFYRSISPIFRFDCYLVLIAFSCSPYCDKMD